jgi:hypothetical protein
MPVAVLPPSSIVVRNLMPGKMASAPRHGSDDHERLGAQRHRGRQRGVRWFMRQILFAGEKPHERPALLGLVVAHRAAQHREVRLQGVQDLALRGWPRHVELHLTTNPRQRPQVGGKEDPDHGRVWTSTDSTGGRSRTIGAQLSPAFADAYTCPPVVPK